MAHPVKCFYCGSTFDRDKEAFVAVPNKAKRYAHELCYKRAAQADEQQKRDKEILEGYIKELFKCDTIPSKVVKQLESYSKENYTYSGIYKTLKYFYEVKHGDLEKSNGGIGIVPYVYEEAKRYWYNIWLIREQNKEVQTQQVELPAREIHIISPERKPMKHIRKLFAFLDSEEEGTD